MRRTFIKFPNKLEQQEYLKSKRFDRKIVFWLRTISFTLLIIALASPFTLESKTVQGNPKLTILIDNSSSMALYEPNLGIELHKKLEGAIPVNVRTIATGDSSPIGNGILNNIESNDNVLVITDGNNNEGKLLGDIILFASTINASVSALDIQPIRADAGVTIRGPPELIKDSEGDFVVSVDVAGKDVPYNLQVLVDDNVLLEQQGKNSQDFKFERKFSDNKYHKITAKLLDVGSKDYFKNNNEYYKSVKVVPRPKLLYVTQQNSPLAANLNNIYELDVKDKIPDDLLNYMAVIINNIDASKILPKFNTLNDHVTNGNGIVFVGGDSAFESGNYKGTLIETLLPVKMGAGEEENKSDVSIALVIDISQGTEDYIKVEKALALSVLDSLNEKNNVGAVAFGGPPPCRAYKIAEIRPLKEHKKELADKISRLKFDGQSCFDIGIGGGFDLMKNAGGGKNIVFISDGKAAGNVKLKEDTVEKVRQVNARGTVVYTVGVGTETDDAASDNNLFLANMAAIGGGIYFKADASNRLKVLFGEPPKGSEEFFNSLIVLDSTHFITEDFDIAATISGYNYVVPKPSARILVTTNKNIPVLTVWRFGLGRVVVLSTDDGIKWGGELLNKKNSKLLTRSINWAIGDLSRKQSYDVTVRDTTLGKKGYVNVISKDFPKHDALKFAKVDVSLYSADFMPTDAGFKELMGATYAVNYNDEYSGLGIRKEFIELVDNTGGRVFKKNDIKGLIEFIKAKSKRIKINSIDVRWPFILAALIIFLFEIAYRRIKENKQLNS